MDGPFPMPTSFANSFPWKIHTLAVAFDGISHFGLMQISTLDPPRSQVHAEPAFAVLLVEAGGRPLAELLEIVLGPRLPISVETMMPVASGEPGRNATRGSRRPG